MGGVERGRRAGADERGSGSIRRERGNGMVTTKRRYTLTDLWDLPDDGQIYELLGGELVVQNAPDTNHALVVAELVGVLLQAQDAGYGYIFPGPYAVAFDFPSRGNAAEDVTHPDLLFVGRAREEVIALRF